MKKFGVVFGKLVQWLREVTVSAKKITTIKKVRMYWFQVFLGPFHGSRIPGWIGKTASAPGWCLRPGHKDQSDLDYVTTSVFPSTCPSPSYVLEDGTGMHLCA